MNIKLLKPNRIFLLFLCISSILLIASCSNTKKEQPDKIDSSNIDSIASILDNNVPSWQKEYNVPAVGVGLIENGELIFSKVYGEHQKGKVAPNNTIFEIQSITKMVVATTTLMLVDKGQWNLDEPLYTYWVDPDVKDDPRHKKLTTRHVLSHTTGFINWRRDHPTKKLTFDFEPGSYYQYSGEGFRYLTKALESKFNKSLEQLVDSILLKPLKMDDSTLGNIKGKDTLRFANTYHEDGTPYNNDYGSWDVTGAYGLKTTIEDMSKLGISIMNRELLSDKLYTQMTTPQNRIFNGSQGLGVWMAHNLPNNEKVINHGGKGMGTATEFTLLPKSNRGIIVFTNGDNGKTICNNVTRASIDLGKKIVEGLYWEREMPEIIEVAQNILKSYSGSYKTNEGSIVNIIERNNRLKLEGVGLPNFEMFPETENRFFPLDFDISIEFLKKGEEVTGFNIYDGEDIVITAEKN